jgi:fimbrial chaperone protein
MAAAIAAASPVHAAGLKVFPVRVLLTPGEAVQTMTIENSSDTPSRIQMRVYSWRQVDGQDVLEPTREVLANPTLFEVAPGGTQITRFGLRTARSDQEKSYRVVLEEIPGTRAPKPGEVQTLLRISIPIFVPPGQPLGKLRWRAWPAGVQKVGFAIRNEGNAHVQINRLTLKRHDGKALGQQHMSVYLLPGSTRQVELNVGSPIAAGQALVLDATTDQADVTAELVAERPPNEAPAP